MHDSREDKDCSQNGNRNMPSDDLFPQHISESQQQGQSGNLAQTTILATDQQVRIRRQFLDTLFHQGQNRRTCLRVRIGHRERLQGIHQRPGSHLRRERDQQEHTSHQSRVENVVPQATKRHLTDTDRRQGTDDHDPKWQVGWQVESQQHTSQDSGTIQDSRFLLQKELLDAVHN